MNEITHIYIANNESFLKIDINKLNVIVLIDDYYLMFDWKVENNDLQSLDQLFVLNLNPEVKPQVLFYHLKISNEEL